MKVTKDVVETRQRFFERNLSVQADFNECNILDSGRKRLISSQIESGPICLHEIKYAVNNLSLLSNIGADGVSQEHLHNDANHLGLLEVFNLTYRSGVAPAVWRSLHMKAMRKKGDS
eukprot:Platyproteum_vivax@DN10928_c0_g1_i1.p1